MARGVYIVGEDEVTRAIIVRIIQEYAPHLSIIQYIPARGSEIKSKINKLNRVALQSPVVLLSDLDTDPCAPIAKNHLTNGVFPISPEFVISIAVDEAEAWLLADTNGFASYFGIPIEQMPNCSLQSFLGPRRRMEMSIPMKSSYYITHHLINHSSKGQLKAQIFATTSCKGKEYNEAIIPFIRTKWNISAARQKSYSLDGMIKRIQRIHP